MSKFTPVYFRGIAERTLRGDDHDRNPDLLREKLEEAAQRIEELQGLCCDAADVLEEIIPMHIYDEGEEPPDAPERAWVSKLREAATG
jgi:hypothetical protein